MPMFHVAGGHLLTESEYQRDGRRFADFLADRSHGLSMLSLKADEGAVARFGDSIGASDGWKPTPIVEGGPLSIQIRHVYTGKHPKDGFVTGKHADMLLTSALKGYSAFAPAARAINFLSKDVTARSHLKSPKATEQGTPIVAYYPALVSDSLIVTIDMAFDRFPKELFDSIGGGFQSLAGVPIFMPYAGYLMVANSLVRLIGNVADKLTDGRPKFSQSAQLNFNLANAPLTTADLRVLCDFDFPRDTYVYDWDEGIVSIADGKPYDGDSPYVVLLIDGAARADLKEFAPSVASAAMLERFLGNAPGSEVGIEGFVSAMKLLNDYKYRGEAEKIAEQLADSSLSAADKAALEKRYASVVANILTAELKPAKA